MVESSRPEDLLDALEEQLERFYSGSRPAPVQVMTIHKAKGLEFDTVILPGLHKGVGGSDRPLLRLHEISLGQEQGVLMAPLKRQGAEGASLYDYLGLLDREEEASEARRTLYVALTRAREELHLFGAWRMTGGSRNPEPGCASGTFMDMLWPAFETLIDPDTFVEEPGDTEAAPPLLPQLRLNGEPDLEKLAFESPEGPPEPELRLPDRNATALGEALHLWLELMHDHWHRDWSMEWFEGHADALASTLRRAGADSGNIPELLPGLLELIRSVLDSETGRVVVSPEGKDGSWAELELISRDGVSLRRNIIDRLYRSEPGGYVLVDYKTSSDEESTRLKWQAQLSRYRAIVESTTSIGAVKTWIYLPELDRRIELTTRETGDDGS